MIKINKRLIDAAKNGDLILVKKMIRYGADVHAHNDLALRSASKHNHLDVIKYLVNKCCSTPRNENISMEERIERTRRIKNGCLKNKELAHEFFISTGFYTAKGRLKRKFRT
jgi:hypothetical protein